VIILDLDNIDNDTVMELEKDNSIIYLHTEHVGADEYRYSYLTFENKKIADNYLLKELENYSKLETLLSKLEYDSLEDLLRYEDNNTIILAMQSINKHWFGIHKTGKNIDQILNEILEG
jgi:hypothetical protein